MTEWLIALCGRDATYIDYVTDRLGHDRRYSVAIDKVRALGWSPTRDLGEALADTVDWFKANRWWWEPLRARARG